MGKVTGKLRSWRFQAFYKAIFNKDSRLRYVLNSRYVQNATSENRKRFDRN